MMEKEERLPPVHPGEVLLEDFMKPLHLSQYRLAQDIGVPALRIRQIVHGKRAGVIKGRLCWSPTLIGWVLAVFFSLLARWLGGEEVTL